MKVSLNAFVADVRRHFRKYTPIQQSVILFRFSIALSVLALALICTGFMVDQFHEDNPQNTQITGTNFVYNAPGIVVGHRNLKLMFPECDTPETGKRLESILFDPAGVSFDKLSRGPTGTDDVYDLFVTPDVNSIAGQYFGSFEMYNKFGWAGQLFSFIAMGLQFLSLLLSLWSGTPPAPFMTSKPIFNQSSSARVWGMIHHLMSFGAIICLFIDLLLVSLYMDLVVGRAVEFAFDLCNVSPDLDELPLMQFYGRYLAEKANLDGMTGGLFKLAMILLMFQAVLVFFLGTDQVRWESSNSGYSIPASKLRQLPWYASIWRFPISLFLLTCALSAYVISLLYTRDNGFLLNIHTWHSVTSSKTGTGSTLSGAFSDLLMDTLSVFHVSESLPRAVKWICLGFVSALGIGSTDPTRFMSKVTQLLGIIFLLQSITSVSTLVPTPTSPLATPRCFSPPPIGSWGIERIIHNVRCNHLMFSMDSAIITLCMTIVLAYLRYGPINVRLPGYILVLSFSSAFVCLPIAARMSYSMDVLVGVLIAGLLVFSQSPAFKMLFRFEKPPPDIDHAVTKLNFQPGEILNDKVIPIMAECLRRIQLYRIAACHLPGLAIDPAELYEIKVLYKQLGSAVDSAKAAKPLEPMSPRGKLRPLPPSNELGSETPPDTEINDIIAILAHQEPPQEAPVPIGISRPNG